MLPDEDTDLDKLYQVELEIKDSSNKLNNGPTEREMREQSKVEKKNKLLAEQAIARYMKNHKG